jgi:hypothetical protein
MTGHQTAAGSDQAHTHGAPPSAGPYPSGNQPTGTATPGDVARALDRLAAGVRRVLEQAPAGGAR